MGQSGVGRTGLVGLLLGGSMVRQLLGGKWPHSIASQSLLESLTPAPLGGVQEQDQQGRARRTGRMSLLLEP